MIFTNVKQRIRDIKSMHIQVFFVMVCAGLVPAFLLFGTVLHAFEDKMMEQRIDTLEYQGKVIANLLLNSNMSFAGEGNEPGEAEREIEQLADIYEGRIIIVDQKLHVLKDTYKLEKGKTIISEDVVQALDGEKSRYINKEDQYVELVLPITVEDTKENAGVMILSFSIKDIYSLYDSVEKNGRIILYVLSMVVFVCALLYSRRLKKPMDSIVASIDHMTEGYMSEQIPIPNTYTELQDITESVNRLTARLQKLEDSRQEFVSNVSHELKTPITSMKVLADSLIGQENVPNEYYREFMEDIAAEIDRESNIINDLLALVKMDQKSGQMNIESRNINELIEQILKRIRPIAAKRNIELVFVSFRPVIAEIDEVKLSLAINNLIENAVKYNRDDGWVHVSLNADHRFFYIKVSDSGVGIPEDSLDRVFERFSRVDKARSRETGGSGLGLSITRSAVLMHRGAIKIYSKEQEGTTFTVRIPINHVQ